MTRGPARHRRVYLRVSRPGLGLLAAGEPLPTAGRLGYAVTELVRAAFPDQDEEELEYDAMCAAVESTPAGPAEKVAPAPVLIIAADVPVAGVREVAPTVDDAGPVPARLAYAVELEGPLRVTQVVSVHVQDDLDDPDAELLWYDVSELSALVAGAN